jgi:hypothetical protein
MTFTCMCGDTTDADRFLDDHVRLIHPDLYEADLMDGPVEVAC